MARKTTAARHRNFEDLEAGTRRPHLHLEVPAIGHLAHAEAFEHIGADRPEGAHVAVAHPVDEADHGSDDAAGEHLMDSHAPLLTRAACA